MIIVLKQNQEMHKMFRKKDHESKHRCMKVVDIKRRSINLFVCVTCLLISHPNFLISNSNLIAN
jgi:hypothetical protein